MSTRRFVNVFIEPNANCPEGCSQRFQATSDPRVITLIRHDPGTGAPVLCDVTGWSSERGGSACPARATEVEDSGAGVVTLVYGGDWGLRLTPHEGGAPFGEPYLLLDGDAILG